MNATMLTIKDYEKVTGLHITKNTGKLDGFMSISTSNHENSFCKCNKGIDGSICQHCYADKMEEQYSNLEKCNIKNGRILKSQILEVFPIIPTLFFRFEAFGDLENEKQVINYFNIAKHNPLVRFGLWTKNPVIIDKVMKAGIEKPSNLTIGISSLFLDVQVSLKKFEYFTDFYFTVYDFKGLKEAADNGKPIEINCGGRSCITCQQCYTCNKKPGEKPLVINECLKKDLKKAVKAGLAE